MQIRPALSAPLPQGPGAGAGGDSPSTGARDFAATLNSAAGAQRAAVAHPQPASSSLSPQHPDPGAAAAHRGERPPAAPRSGNAPPSGGALPPAGEGAPPASSSDGSSGSAVSGSGASGRGASGRGTAQSPSAGAGDAGATLAAAAGATTAGSPTPPVLAPGSAASAAYAMSGPSAPAPLSTMSATAALSTTNDASAATPASGADATSGGPDGVTGPSAAAAGTAAASASDALNAGAAAAASASAPSLEAGAASSGATTSPLVGAMRLALTASADGVEQSATALPPPQVADASRIADAAAGASTQASHPTSLAARFLGQVDSVLESPEPAPTRTSDTSAPTPTVNPVPIAGPPPAMTGASSLLASGLAPPLAVVAASGGDEAEPQFTSDRRGHATLAGPDLGTDGLLPAIGNSTAASDSGAPTIKLDSTVDSPSFPAELAGHVAYLIGNNLGSAKLQVTPPQLGPIDLQISVQGNSAQIVMSTHSALTHAALESSAPALRELLGSQGFAQVSVDISQRSFQEQPAFTQPESTFVPRESVAAEPIAPGRGTRSLLDAYA